MKKVFVSSACGGTRGRDIRFFEEASKQGEVHLLLWSDGQAEALTGAAPRFNRDERLYLAESLRFIARVYAPENHFPADQPPVPEGLEPDIWFYPAEEDSPERREFCRRSGMEPVLCTPEMLDGYPVSGEEALSPAGREKKKVLVTGCFDLFHTGHIRFFEEVSQFGDLYVVIGSDKNVRLLKGEGRPLFSEEERRYIIQSMRYVTLSLVSTGSGWMDAEPEIHRLKPDIYAVNEDGDVPEKREFCEKEGLTYLILKRTPKEGLPERSSTQLRGF